MLHRSAENPDDTDPDACRHRGGEGLAACDAASPGRGGDHLVLSRRHAHGFIETFGATPGIRRM